MIEITLQYLASQGLNETFLKRFWAKVQKTESCWLWIGAKSGAGTGYGHIQKNGRKGGVIGSHCASWILHRGPIPEGHYVLHKCPNGNSLCLNPEHLYTGTQRENMLDTIRDGHYRTQHPFGERAANAKLTQAQAEEIRKLRSNGWKSRELEKRFHVCRYTIWAVCANRRFLQGTFHGLT